MRHDLIKRLLTQFETYLQPENIPPELLTGKPTINTHSPYRRLFPQRTRCMFITQQVGDTGTKSRHAHHYLFKTIDINGAPLRAMALFDDQINIYPNMKYITINLDNSNGCAYFDWDSKDPDADFPKKLNCIFYKNASLEDALDILKSDLCDYQFGNPKHPWIKAETISGKNIYGIDSDSVIEDLITDGALPIDKITDALKWIEQQKPEPIPPLNFNSPEIQQILSVINPDNYKS